MAAPNRILVTGGAGFIGSHVCPLLLDQGHAVTVVDNLSIGLKQRVPDGAELVTADVRDREAMRRIVAERKIDKICHLAARVSIRASTDSFHDDADVNVMGTLSMLEAALSGSVEKFVFASSMAVYADSPTPAPISEEYSTASISPYGISKLASERFIENILGRAGIDNIRLRFFNTYGPNQTYTPYVGVITIFISKLLAGEAPTVFGDGKQLRDFVSVYDIAVGVTSALEREGLSGVFNLGSGRARSVNEIAELLRAKIAPSVEIAHAAARPGEINNSVADITAARQALDFTPIGNLDALADEVIEAIRAAQSKPTPRASTQNG